MAGVDKDLDAVAEELYGVRPAEFTAAREEYVARARKAGEKELAAAIAALRKPTLAAWTAGLLPRHRPAEARQFASLGEALRAAHRTLDGARLRELSHERHVVMGQLARTARALAAEAGQPVSESVLREVEQILHAVLADEVVAGEWENGRLAKAPETVLGFDGLEPAPGVVPPTAPRAVGPAVAGEPSPKAGKRESAGAAARSRQDRTEKARAELATARREAEELEAELTAAEQAAQRARTAMEAAQEEARRAGDQLEAARARNKQATERHREADRAAKRARTRVESAERKLTELTEPTDRER